MRTMQFSLIVVLIFFQSCVFEKKYSEEIVSGDLGNRINDFFTSLEPYGLSGSFLFAQGDSVIFHRAFGLSDRKTNSRNTTNTLFSIGSLTKQFTAAAILSLEAEGELKTTDSLFRFFKDVPEDKQNIQIHHLLTHTSGLPLYVNESNDFEKTTKNEMFQILWKSDLLFKPGKSYAYSNAGYSLLAAIVEEVAKSDYETYLRERLLKRAGLQHTGYKIPDWSNMEEAVNYVGEKSYGTFQSRNFFNWNLIGNGALLSTTEEMFRWYLALRNRTILPKEQMTSFFTPFLEDYAYGWEVYDNGEIIEHSGSGQGNNSLILWYPKADIVFIGLSNYAFDGLDMIDYIYDDVDLLLDGEDGHKAPSVLPLKKSVDLVEGTYSTPEYGTFRVDKINGSYKLSTYSQGVINLLKNLPKNSFFKENNLADRVFSEILTNNTFSLLDSLVEEKDRFERLSAAISRYLKAYEFIDPTPHLYRAEKVGESMRSLVAVTESGNQPEEFAESFFLSIVWNEKGFGGIGRTIMPYRPVVYYLIPTDENKVVGYDLYNKHGVQLEFEANFSQMKLTVDENRDITFFKTQKDE